MPTINSSKFSYRVCIKKTSLCKSVLLTFNCLQKLKGKSNLYHFIRFTSIRGSKCCMKALTLHTVLEQADLLSKNIHIRGKIIAKLLFQKEI